MVQANQKHAMLRTDLDRLGTVLRHDLRKRPPATFRALSGDEIGELHTGDLERVDHGGLYLERLSFVLQVVPDELDPHIESGSVNLMDARELQLGARLGRIDALCVPRMGVRSVPYSLADVEDTAVFQRIAERVDVVPKLLAHTGQERQWIERSWFTLHLPVYWLIIRSSWAPGTSILRPLRRP
jgi:hypothetical protein